MNIVPQFVNSRKEPPHIDQACVKKKFTPALLTQAPLNNIEPIKKALSSARVIALRL